MRSRETIERDIELTKKRLENYLAQEEKLLTNNVQGYTIGSRSLQYRQTSLKSVEEMIRPNHKLRVDAP